MEIQFCHIGSGFLRCLERKGNSGRGAVLAVPVLGSYLKDLRRKVLFFEILPGIAVRQELGSPAPGFPEIEVDGDARVYAELDAGSVDCSKGKDSAAIQAELWCRSCTQREASPHSVTQA